MLCSRWVHFVLKWDRTKKIRLGSVQSESGRELLAYAGLNVDDVDTMLLIERGVPYARSSAFHRVCRYFRFPMFLCSVGLIAPSCIRDWAYDRIAKNRYTLFGKQELCMLPAPEERERFLPV